MTMASMQIFFPTRAHALLESDRYNACARMGKKFISIRRPTWSKWMDFPSVEEQPDLFLPLRKQLNDVIHACPSLGLVFLELQHESLQLLVDVLLVPKAFVHIRPPVRHRR